MFRSNTAVAASAKETLIRICETAAFKIQIAFHSSDTTRPPPRAQDKPSVPSHTLRFNTLDTVPSYSGCSLHAHCCEHATTPPHSPAEDRVQTIMKPIGVEVELDASALNGESGVDARTVERHGKGGGLAKALHVVLAAHELFKLLLLLRQLHAVVAFVLLQQRNAIRVIDGVSGERARTLG
eukprot:6717865-Prymnesium_polylepis.1